MGILASLRKSIQLAKDSRIAKQIVSFRTGLPFVGGLRADHRTLQRWLQSWVYICMDRNAGGVAQTECGLFQRNTEEQRSAKAVGLSRPTRQLTTKEKRYFRKAARTFWTDESERVLDHPFLDLLEAPNPLLDCFGLIYLTAGSLQLLGNAYWYVSFDSDNMPVELWPLPAQLVYPILGEKQVFDKYEFRWGSEVQKFDAREIVHFRKPSVIDTLSGFGNLSGILEASETNVRMAEFERALFENMALPDAIITPKGQTSAHAIQSLLDSWREQFMGWKKAGKLAAAPFELDVKRLTMNMKELAHKDTRQLIREEITTGFGIPLPILFVEGMTFANLFGAHQAWARWTLQPFHHIIADGINRQLMPFYSMSPETEMEGGDRPMRKAQFFVAFDNAVPEDEDAILDRRIKRVEANIETIDEFREEDGLDPVPWGSEPWMNAGLATPSMMAAAQDAEEVERAARIETSRLAATQPSIDPTQQVAEGPTLTELVQMQRNAIIAGDIAMTNVARRAIAQMLGVDPPPDITKIKPATGIASGVVEPDEAATNIGDVNVIEAQPEEPVEDAQEGGSDAAGDDEGGETPDDASGDGNRRRSDSGDDDDKSASLAARHQSADAFKGWQTWYAKLPQELFEDEAKPETLQGQIRQFLNGLIAEAVAAVRDEKRSKEASPDLLNVIFDEDAIDEFSGILQPFVLGAFEQGVSLGEAEMIARLRSAGQFDENAGDVADLLERADAQRAARRLSSDAASSLITTVREAAATAIERGIADGKTDVQIADDLAAAMGKRRDTAALVIAQTELNNALNMGAVETWKANDVTTIEWIAGPDPCEYCEALDGQTTTVGKPFIKKGATLRGTEGGAMAIKYRDVHHPTLHPRCRCTIGPVIG